MGVDSKHPDYTDRWMDWEKMEDCYEGEGAIKERRETYLPATAGHRLDGMGVDQDGYKDYSAYLLRAVYPDFVRQTVDGMVGAMHQEPPKIDLPDPMLPLMERATNRGESLVTLLRWINFQQLLYGRLGLLVEVPDLGSPRDLPFMVPYRATSLINWDDGIKTDGRRALDLAVLDESGYIRSDAFNWDLEKRFRVLSRGSLSKDPGEGGPYLVGKSVGNSEVPSEWVSPSLSGVTLEEIPFTIINATDLASEVPPCPLLGLANLCLAIYRGEADYRHNLFMQGQETLVTVGAEEKEGETRVGAGSKIELPPGGNAFYVGVSAAGLGEQRTALENDRARAGELSIALLSDGGGAESGEALRIRVAAKTATLVTIAQTGAAGLVLALRHVGRFMGLSPEALDEIKVEPNLRFAQQPLSSSELLGYMQAKIAGAPISLESIHRIMRKRDLTQKTFEDEQDEIGMEGPVT